jgi:hypothetical protein
VDYRNDKEIEMSHHSEELTPLFRQEAERMGLGATGKFPLGKMNETDQGEIIVGIAAVPADKLVVMNFGTPTAYIAFTGDQALEIADSLRDRALELRGIKPG